MLTTIPFQGFYQSCHDDAIDRAIEYAAEINDNGDSNPIIASELQRCIDFRKVYEAYAKDYTQALAIFLKVNLRYDEFSSPREYNFTTDKIFANISDSGFQRLYDSVDKAALADLVADRFTSRDGFISFYSGDIADWPEDITEWDHNQAGTVLELAATEQDWQEDEYSHETNSNGDLDNWIDAAMDQRGHRLLRIVGYLRERSYRRYA